MDRVEKRTRKKISLWTFLKFVDTFHVTSTYIYIYTSIHVRSPLSITAFRFLKRDFRRTIPFETLNYVTSVLYLILDLTLEGKDFTIEHGWIYPLSVIRYSIELLHISGKVASRRENKQQRTKRKRREIKREREIRGSSRCFRPVSMGQVFAHLFQSGFSSVDGRFSTFTKEWFPAKSV